MGSEPAVWDTARWCLTGMHMRTSSRWPQPAHTPPYSLTPKAMSVSCKGWYPSTFLHPALWIFYPSQRSCSVLWLQPETSHTKTHEGETGEHMVIKNMIYPFSWCLYWWSTPLLVTATRLVTSVLHNDTHVATSSIKNDATEFWSWLLELNDL